MPLARSPSAHSHSYGSVYEAIALEGNSLHMDTGARVAIKVVRNAAKDFPAVNAKRVLREICILRNFRHPNSTSSLF